MSAKSDAEDRRVKIEDAILEFANWRDDSYQISRSNPPSDRRYALKEKMAEAVTKIEGIFK